MPPTTWRSLLRRARPNWSAALQERERKEEWKDLLYKKLMRQQGPLRRPMQ
jgi:hypothetical protein